MALETDFIVVGSGIAGLRAGLELARAGARVMVLTKDRREESNTEYAQGGIAVALADTDEASLHEEDTISAGAGLCDERAVVLASGGAGQLYLHTTNPAVATGDGMAMAFDAGAELADMEFVQFHPTALNLEGAPRFLLSEALRGEGGVLRNAAGKRFMPRYHDAAELAPRDIVTRSIVAEMGRTATRTVFLDMTAFDAAYLRRRFPKIYSTCLSLGLDLAHDPVPVSPAAHYIMGGVRTDLEGRTTLPGLYAAGEVACTGVHGANRLASNSLLEGLVFGARAGRAAAEDLSDSGANAAPLADEFEEASVIEEENARATSRADARRAGAAALAVRKRVR